MLLSSFRYWGPVRMPIAAKHLGEFRIRKSHFCLFFCNPDNYNVVIFATSFSCWQPGWSSLL